MDENKKNLNLEDRGKSGGEAVAHVGRPDLAEALAGDDKGETKDVSVLVSRRGNDLGDQRLDVGRDPDRLVHKAIVFLVPDDGVLGHLTVSLDRADFERRELTIGSTVELEVEGIQLLEVGCKIFECFHFKKNKTQQTIKFPIVSLPRVTLNSLKCRVVV